MIGRKFKDFTNNKMTYLGAGLIVIDGVLSAFGHPLPNWALLIVGGGTVAAHRYSIQKVQYAIQWAKYAGIDILGMVTEPEPEGTKTTTTTTTETH